MRIAAHAWRAPTTVVAQQHRRKAATVDKQQRLSACREMSINRFKQRRR